MFNRSAACRVVSSREAARAIYFRHVIPNGAISHREADRLSFRIGAIDEGDRHVAGRADL